MLCPVGARGFPRPLCPGQGASGPGPPSGAGPPRPAPCPEPPLEGTFSKQAPAAPGRGLANPSGGPASAAGEEHVTKTHRHTGAGGGSVRPRPCPARPPHSGCSAGQVSLGVLCQVAVRCPVGLPSAAGWRLGGRQDGGPRPRPGGDHSSSVFSDQDRSSLGFVGPGLRATRRHLRGG